MDMRSPVFRFAKVENERFVSPKGWPLSSSTFLKQKEDADTTPNISPMKNTGNSSRGKKRSVSWPPNTNNGSDHKTDSPYCANRRNGDDDNDQQQARSPSNEGHKRQAPQPWTWKLASASPLPMFYPIQDWNTLKVDDLPLDTITSRISEFLRVNSVETYYDNEKGIVRCRTISGCVFVINIWKDRDDKTFLIHFQHVSGCSMHSANIRSGLRNAILMSKQQKPSPLFTSSSVPTILSSCEIRVHRSNEDRSSISSHEVEESSLQCCERMLKSHLLSENRLGLESLAMITDKTKTIPKAMREACFAVSHDSGLQDLLRRYLEVASFTNSSPYAGEEQEQASFGLYHERRNHILVLQILAQSLLLSNGTTSMIRQNKFWEVVFTSIADNIEHASTRPLEATLSARCLSELLDADAISPWELSSKRVGHDSSRFEQSIKNAHRFGSLHNASLEGETGRLLCRLDAAAH